MNVSDIIPRLLLGPGPSPVSERVLRAMARPTLGHLDPQFLDLVDDVSRMLRAVFGTENQTTFAFSGTGSAGMEGSLVNLIAPGDTVVVGINGVFGTRMAEIARRAGATVHVVEAPWGEIIPPERMMEALEAYPDARLATLVHAETSTGIHQPLAEVGDFLRNRDTLFLVDAVTSLGGVPVEVDRWGIDACYSGTQKCLGVPPGLSPVTFSDRAVARIRGRASASQSWYLDVNLIAQYLGAGRRYHHTAPINMFYALHEALVMVQEEGLEARLRRHEEVGRRLQNELVERGFELFAQEGYRLPQLTSAALPPSRDEGVLRKRLLEEFGIEIGGGLGPAQGKIWRIGLMGSGATHESVDRLLEAVDRLLGD